LTVNNKASIKLGENFLLTACVFCEAVKPDPSKLCSNPQFTNSTKRESHSFASFAKDPWAQENQTCAKQPWRSQIPNLKSGEFHPPLHTMVKSLTHLGHKDQTHCSHPLLLLASSPLLSSALTWWEMKRRSKNTRTLRCEAFSFQTEAIYQGTNPLPREGRQSRLYGAQRAFDNKKVL
jgi:hypothetical protein